MAGMSMTMKGSWADPVKAVENGILRNFLMSRSPIDGFDHSNGHGRRQPGSRSGFTAIEPDRFEHALRIRRQTASDAAR